MTSNDSFTPTQTKLICSIIECLRVPLDTAAVDWEAVASKNGYANAASAQAQWRTLKGKKGLGGGKKRNADGGESADAEGGSSPVAAKKAKGGKGKKGQAGDEVVVDGDANGGGVVKDEPAEEGV